MSAVIVGIHGLANKPPKQTLANWWQTSIREGLEKNCGLSNPKFDLQMVFWADLLYKRLQHLDADFYFDSLYNNQPYVEAGAGALKPYNEGFIDDVRAKGLGLVGKAVDLLKDRFDIDFLGDWMAAKVLKDLHFYYEETREIRDREKQKRPARRVLQEELRGVLTPLKGRRIMLVAHSMGSIIAYDVLRDLGRQDPDLQVAHFVTIGSPLGLPYVKGKIRDERSYAREPVRTPSATTERWVNYADHLDLVTMDLHLGDDFGANDRGVRVQDDVVINDYTSPDGSRNHHKSYGYLRTPEFSAHVKEFLGL